MSATPPGGKGAPPIKSAPVIESEPARERAPVIANRKGFYFEVAAGGHSTLERHEHVHLVVIGRGAGHCLVGDEVFAVKALDAVIIPSLTWHQFRATGTEPLGFFCVVARERDRPRLPTEEDLKVLRADPAIEAFIRV